MKKRCDHLGVIKKLSLVVLLTMTLSPAFCTSSTPEESDNVTFIRTNIPKEMGTLTFSFLPVEELGKMALVSKGFKEISEQDILWNKWIPDVNTKKEFVEHVTSRVIMYNLGNFNKLSISSYDLFTILNAGRISVNDCLYQFNNSGIINSKGDLLSIIRVMKPFYNPYITLNNDQSVSLIYEERERYNYFRVRFEEVEADPNRFINFVAPTPKTDLTQDYVAQGDLYIKRLNCLSDHYKPREYNYWGRIHVFDELEELLYGLDKLINASNDIKDAAVFFFVQKYVDFRKKNSSRYGDGYYAENYLRQVLNKIRVSLHTDFVSTEYIPPAEYVVANEALPEEIRQYYSRPF
jgi:hypothetical protein